MIKLLLCLTCLGIALYCYIDSRNTLTAARMTVPTLTKKLRSIQDENTRLQFEIEKFENPLNLMELARKPQFSHLKQPLTTDIITVRLPHHYADSQASSHLAAAHEAPGAK